MSFKDKMLKAQKELQEQYEESIKTTKDSGFGNYGTIFLPEGLNDLPLYKLETRTHWIDVVPFFAGSQHPKAEKGRLVYHVDLWVHRDIGLENDHFVCQRATWKKADPICTWINKNKPEKRIFKKVAQKRRCVYFVYDRYNEEDGLQILEVSHFFFQKHIDAIMKNPRGGPPVNFAHPTKGKSIIFEISKSGSYTSDDGKKLDAKTAQGFRFEPRDTPIPEEIFEATFPLDEAINMFPDEKKQRAAIGSDENMDAGSVDEEEEVEDGIGEVDEGQDIDESWEDNPEEEEEPEEEETEEEPEEEEEEDIRSELEGMSRSELKKYIKQCELDITVYRSWDDDKIREEILNVIEEGAEEEQQEEEEVASDECPHGHEFGVDLEQFPECQNCDNWDPCNEAMEADNEEEEAPPEKQKKKPTKKSGKKKPPVLRKKK